VMEYSLFQQRNWEIFVDFFWFKSVNFQLILTKIDQCFFYSSFFYTEILAKLNQKRKKEKK
jgi:hypothetical protein